MSKERNVAGHGNGEAEMARDRGWISLWSCWVFIFEEDKEGLKEGGGGGDQYRP